MYKRSSLANCGSYVLRMTAIVCCCTVFLSAIAQSSEVSISALTTEYRSNPLGIESSPAFSWILNSTKRNLFQSAFEIIVGERLNDVIAGKGNMWAPGRIASSETALIVYKGNLLQSNKKYY